MILAIISISLRFVKRTRIIATDVATAVYDFADAVMLSAKTATGQYPLEAVETMNRVIETTEAAAAPPPVADRPSIDDEIAPSVADAVSRCRGQFDGKLIMAFTTSGFTASLISKMFPSPPMAAVTPEQRLLRQLTLCRQYKLAGRGDKVIITGGVPFGLVQRTNMMTVLELKGGG